VIKVVFGGVRRRRARVAQAGNGSRASIQFRGTPLAPGRLSVLVSVATIPPTIAATQPYRTGPASPPEIIGCIG
jgi:hypothetical protein